MKYRLVVILGCLPLAVLTVWSFAELGAIQDRSAVQGSKDEFAAQVAAAVELRAEHSAVKNAAEGLAEGDLLTRPTTGSLDKVSTKSSLRPAADAWQQWTETHGLVRQFLEAERLAGSVNPEQLREATTQMEQLRSKCRAMPQGTNATMLALLDQRLAEVNRKLKRGELFVQAEAAVTRAREAFRAERYEECASLCHQWLSQYAALDPSTSEKVKVLRQRAEFRADHARLTIQLHSSGPLAERKRLLEGFLGKYSDRTARSDLELQVLQQRQRELDGFREQLLDEQQMRAASTSLAQMERDLPLEFHARLRGAAAIAARHPSPTVHRMLTQRLDGWLREALPEKRLEESPLVQEAETRRHEIARGFFRSVKGPDGSVIGYKRYQTYEELLHPKAEVGMYRKEEFLDKPDQSTLQRLVAQYQQARDKLLAAVTEKDQWAEFAELCETLELQLQQYRRKPGASQEPLSFVREGRLAREVASGPSLRSLAQIVGAK
jgi:hypothetical protein